MTATATLLAYMKVDLGISVTTYDTLLTRYITKAISFVGGYTGIALDSIPAGLDEAVVALAIGMYQTRGIEGETSHSEGGVSVSVDVLPKHLKALLDKNRNARVGNV